MAAPPNSKPNGASSGAGTPPSNSGDEKEAGPVSDDKPNAPQEQQKDAEPEQERFPLDYFETNSVVLLGIQPGIAAGALVAAKRKTLTLDEAKALASDYSKRPVEFAGQTEED